MNVFSTIGKTLLRHAPEIMTGIGIAGVAATAVVAVNDTRRAIPEMERLRKRYKGHDIPISEKTKALCKVYMPTIGCAAVTSMCIFGAARGFTKRNAALVGLYSLSTSAFQEYSKKVVEKIGGAKEKEIRDDIAKDHLYKEPLTSSNMVIVESEGRTRFRDELSGQKFYSDIESVKQIQNRINHRIISTAEGWFSVNEVLMEYDLDRVADGDLRGFDVDNLMDIILSPIIDRDEKPTVVISYRNIPVLFDGRRVER